MFLFFQWCHLCRDGSDLLAICDLCGSATCKRCIPALGTVPGEHLAACTFKCDRCVPSRAIFHVGVWLVSPNIVLTQILQGLFKPDGSPLFPEGMAITAKYPARPMKQRFRTPSLVIIEFVLEQLPQVGTTSQLLHLSLVQNYMMSPDLLCFKQIPFDIGSPEALATHSTKVVETVQELQKGYVF